jgi:hypothetical protein
MLEALALEVLALERPHPEAAGLAWTTRWLRLPFRQ